MNLITESIKVIGLTKLAKACDISLAAILGWEKRGHLPRTDWTGETNFSFTIENLSDGKIKREALLNYFNNKDK